MIKVVKGTRLKLGASNIAKKLYRVIPFTIFIFFILLSMGASGKKECADIRNYYLSVSLSKEHLAEVKKAIKHVESKVKCVCFREVELADVDRVNALMIFRMDREGHDKDQANKILGYFNRDKNIIVLSDTSMVGLPHPLTKETLFKVSVHELAHWLGMPAGHAFAEELSGKSLLTPVISKESKPLLYKRDVDYLNHVVCVESQVIFNIPSHR